jgi:hypothetical protein
MKNIKIPRRNRLSASLLAGCMAAAVGMTAVAETGAQELKVVEGKLVPLFHAISGQHDAQQPQRDQQRLGTSPGQQSPDRTLPGQPTDYTDELRPGTGSGTGTGIGGQTPGTRTGIGTGAPGTGTGVGTQEPDTTGIRTPQPDTRTGGIGTQQPGFETTGSLGAMQMTGPLALIADSTPRTIQDTAAGSELPGTGRPSTPERTETSPTLGERVRGILGGSGEGDIYVLVFDPSDPQGQSAYQRAQSMAQGAAMPRGMKQPWDTEQTQRPLGQTQGLDSETDRERVRDEQQYGHAQEQTVRVTGRVMERDGLHVIAVHSVEPKIEQQQQQ